MKRVFELFILLTIILTACAPQATVTTTPTFFIATPTSVVAVQTTTPTPPSSEPRHGLVAKYYNPRYPTAPIAVRNEWGVFLRVEDYGSPIPGVPVDFSVIWDGYISPPETDEYQFHLTFDDGGVFILNGETMVNDWDDPTLGTQTTEWIQLEKGIRYPITIKMQDIRGLAKAELAWTSKSGGFDHEIITSNYLTVPDGQLPEAVPNPEREVCVPDLSNPDNRYLSGLETPSQIIFEGDINEFNNLSLTTNNLVGLDTAEHVTQFAIIPVGYSDQEIQDIFFPRITALNEIMKQLQIPARYTYINTAFPIKVLQYGTILDIPDEERELARYYVARLVPHPFVPVISIKTRGRSHAQQTDGKWSLVIDDDNSYIYTMLHETGHVFGLGDGYYDTFYTPRDFPNSELVFVDYQGNPVLKPEWNNWLETHPTKFINTNYTCLGQPLVQIENGSYSIMTKRVTDDEIFHDGVVENIFSPFQYWIMMSHAP